MLLSQVVLTVDGIEQVSGHLVVVAIGHHGSHQGRLLLFNALWMLPRLLRHWSRFVVLELFASLTVIRLGARKTVSSTIVNHLHITTWLALASRKIRHVNTVVGLGRPGRGSVLTPVSHHPLIALFP